MRWTPTNASQFSALIRQTDFWSELSSIKPPLGGANQEDRANSATKREMWEELIEKLTTMSTPNKDELDEESPNINTDALNNS